MVCVPRVFGITSAHDCPTPDGHRGINGASLSQAAPLHIDAGGQHAIVDGLTGRLCIHTLFDRPSVEHRSAILKQATTQAKAFHRPGVDERTIVGQHPAGVVD